MKYQITHCMHLRRQLLTVLSCTLAFDNSYFVVMDWLHIELAELIGTYIENITGYCEPYCDSIFLTTSIMLDTSCKCSLDYLSKPCRAHNEADQENEDIVTFQEDLESHQPLP